MTSALELGNVLNHNLPLSIGDWHDLARSAHAHRVVDDHGVLRFALKVREEVVGWCEDEGVWA
jgi:hypothetical protein